MDQLSNKYWSGYNYDSLIVYPTNNNKKCQNKKDTQSMIFCLFFLLVQKNGRTPSSHQHKKNWLGSWLSDGVAKP